MKKKILGGFAVAVIAAVAAFNVNVNITAGNELSAISLANVEALAQSETGNCPSGCKNIGWGTNEILRCDCSYTSYFSSCASWGC